MRFFNRPRMSSLAFRVLGWHNRTLARLEEQAKFQACTAHETVQLPPGSSINNALGEKDRIQIGSHTVCRGELHLFKPRGLIVVGSYCYVGDHTRIWSAVGITIGDRVLISHSVNIHDHNGHTLSASHRHIQSVRSAEEGVAYMDGVKMGPIQIEDDVWIGFNASVMKGVTLGKGAIIGAATVITKDVPAYAIMVGNPARQVGCAQE